VGNSALRSYDGVRVLLKLILFKQEDKIRILFIPDSFEPGMNKVSLCTFIKENRDLLKLWREPIEGKGS
jgi:hypothetical protein